MFSLRYKYWNYDNSMQKTMDHYGLAENRNDFDWSKAQEWFDLFIC